MGAFGGGGGGGGTVLGEGALELETTRGDAEMEGVPRRGALTGDLESVGDIIEARKGRK